MLPTLLSARFGLFWHTHPIFSWAIGFVGPYIRFCMPVWGYQPKDLVPQLLWPLPVLACRDTRAPWQSWAWRAMCELCHPWLTSQLLGREGGREMGEGLWRWSRCMIGPWWAQIRHIFHDLQVAICDLSFSTLVEGKERWHYSMLALSLQWGWVSNWLLLIAGSQGAHGWQNQPL